MILPLFTNFASCWTTTPIAPSWEPFTLIVPLFVPIALLSKYIPIAFLPSRLIVPLFIALAFAPSANNPIPDSPTVIVAPVAFSTVPVLVAIPIA